MEASIMENLPLELLTKILISLPVKTLIALRSVNKRFLSVIDDPYFVWSHLYHNLYIAPPRVLRVRSELWKLDSSVDGLVVLGSSSYTYKNIGCLWNPSLGVHHHRLLQPKSLPQSRGPTHFALGYHVAANGYRVVATVAGSVRSSVYSVRMDTWTDVVAPHVYCRRFFSKSLYLSSSLCLKERGAAVWTESTDSRELLILVWFDFAAERFYYSDEMPTPFPDLCGLFSMVQSRTKAVVGVGLWKVVGAAVSVWALHAETMSWVPRYLVPREAIPAGVEILKVEEWDGRFLVCYYLSHIDGGRVRLDVVRYDTGKQQAIRRLNLWISEPYPHANWLGLYVESLISFKSGQEYESPNSLINLRY